MRRPLTPLVLACGLLALASSTGLAQDSMLEPLGDFTRDRVDRALVELGLALDPAPEGKRFGRLIVYAEGAFTDDDPALVSWLDALHANTRTEVIAAEIQWRPGEPFDEALVWETVRILRRRAALSLVGVVPVLSDDPAHTVDILAVTHDAWSLVISPSIELNDWDLTRLDVFVGERNLGGHHKELAVVGTLEPDTWSLGVGYADPRLRGSLVRAHTAVEVLLNRSSGDAEGSLHHTEFELPLLRTRTPFGFRVFEEHDIQIDRRFDGLDLLTYDNPDTPEVEAVPFAIDQVTVDALAEGSAAFGTGTRHLLSWGYGLRERDFALFEAENVARETVAAFERDVLPFSELSSFVQLGYHLLVEDWALEEDYQTLSFLEFARLGPELLLQLRYAPEALGSHREHLDTFVFGAYSFAQRGWLGRAGLGFSGRVDFGAPGTATSLRDRALHGRLMLSTPALGPFRLHAGGYAELVFGRLARELRELGKDTGLRGFSVGTALAESVALAQLEVRTLPWRIIAGTVVGGVLFADLGTAFSESDRGGPPLYADIGLGLRSTSRSSRGLVFRLDWGIPLSGQDDAFPGVLTFGIDQMLGPSVVDYDWEQTLEDWPRQPLREQRRLLPGRSLGD